MEFNFNFIIEILLQQEKDILHYIVLKLMLENKLSYGDITQAYIQYLESIKNGALCDYDELKGMVIKAYVDKPQNAPSHIKDIMHYLTDKGRVNATHEQIDAKYGSKKRNSSRKEESL